MLRSPDDPNSSCSSRVPADTHRKRPEVAMKDAYSFGIEEEYFLVDADTKSVDARHAEDVPGDRQGGHQRAGHGRIPAVAVRGRDLAASRHPHRARRASPSAPDRGARSRPSTASPSSPPARIRPRTGAASQQSRRRALRRGDGRPADDRPAQHAVRHARACRAAGPRRPRRRDDADAALSAAVRRAGDLVAVLALAADRAQGLSARRLRRAAAHRRARAVPQQGGVRRLCRRRW